MAPPVLRDYQDRSMKGVRAALRKVRRAILESPTGSGKSVTIAYMIGRAFERDRGSWLLCHRSELVEQLDGALWAAGVPHGVIQSRRPQTKDIVQVASVQTLVNRLHKTPPPDLIAIDECHHATAGSYAKIIDACPEAFIVGLTATPWRLDGRGLGDIFGAIVPGPSVTDLIALGYLSPYRLLAPAQPADVSGVHTKRGDWDRGELAWIMDQTSIIGDAVEHYLKYAHPRTCLVYCVNREHAHHVTDAYRSAGINAVYVAGDTPKAERAAAIKGFRRGVPPVIVSVDLFGEGLDVPGLQAVQLLRPTQSLTLHLQQVGRVLRVEDGKDYALILDHVGNTWRHGLPDDERSWTLDGKRKKKGGSAIEIPAIRHCPECFNVFRTAAECPYCGHAFQVEARLPDQEEGELEEIHAEEHRRRRQAQQRREERDCKTLEDWVMLALERGNKPGWAGIRHGIRQGHGPGTPGSKKLQKEAKAIAEKLRREAA